MILYFFKRRGKRKDWPNIVFQLVPKQINIKYTITRALDNNSTRNNTPRQELMQQQYIDE